MSSSSEIPIVPPSTRPVLDFDNPFNDQSVFSPPKADSKQPFMRLPSLSKFADVEAGERDRSASQPPTPSSRKISGDEFRIPSKQSLEDPRRRIGGSGTESPVIKEFRASAALRPFHSAPVTPCDTPLGSRQGSRQGSPKLQRKSPGILAALFGPGIYGRGAGEGGVRLDHLTEASEEDFTPVGSPGNVFFEELCTKLDDVDGAQKQISELKFSSGVEESEGFSTEPRPNIPRLLKPKKGRRTAEDDDANINFREITFFTPNSM